jgi:hypothetical protein
MWPGHELKVGLRLGPGTADWRRLNRLSVGRRGGRLFAKIGFKILWLQRLRAFGSRLFL